jgi:hypothetical protein
VELETVSGAMDMHFLNADLTNAYAELDNVVLALVPAAGARAPGLLLGAHFDATLDTPGAGPGRGRARAACARNARCGPPAGKRGAVPHGASGLVCRLCSIYAPPRERCAQPGSAA